MSVLVVSGTVNLSCAGQKKMDIPRQHAERYRMTRLLHLMGFQGTGGAAWRARELDMRTVVDVPWVAVWGGPKRSMVETHQFRRQ